MSDETTVPNDDVKNASNPAGSPTLHEQLEAAAAERDQFKEKWTRALADHDNYRRRMQREMEEVGNYSLIEFQNYMGITK